MDWKVKPSTLAKKSLPARVSTFTVSTMAKWLVVLGCFAMLFVFAFSQHECGSYCSFSEVRRRCIESAPSPTGGARPCRNSMIQQQLQECLQTQQCRRKRNVGDEREPSLFQ